jgi:type II secretory pathway pseudopilin PulG
VSLIVLVAVIGLVTAATLRLGATMRRAAAEQALLDIGEQFSDALKSYAAATPPGQPQQPPTLKELLKDPRFPGVRRHLRKVFVDPMTGKAEWGIVYLGDKVGVLAIYSLSQARAIKVANFPTRFRGFEGKEFIADWKFTRDGQPPLPPKSAPGQPAVPPVPAPTPMTGAPLPPPVQETPTAPSPPPEPESAPAPEEEPVPASETTENVEQEKK